MPNYPTMGLHTTIPWREWIRFHVAGIEHHEKDLRFMNAVALTKLVHYPYGIVGQAKDGSGNYTGWATLCRPSGSDFTLVAGADKIIAAGIYYQLIKIEIVNDQSIDIASDIHDLNDPQGSEIDWDHVSSRRYDADNQWPVFPIRGDDIARFHDQRQSDQHECDYGDFFDSCWSLSDFPIPLEIFQWFSAGVPDPAFDATESRKYQDHLFDYGTAIEVRMFLSRFDDTWRNNVDNGETVQLGCTPQKFKIYYWNAVVNSLSPARWKTGQDFILNGLGFDPSDDDLWAYAINSDDPWNDRVISIQFIGKQGEGTFTVNEPDFTISNTQITIASADMPALPNGSYDILLTKENDGMGPADRTESYAGDWRTRSDGRMFEGERLVLFVGNSPKYITPVILTKWRFKDPAGGIALRNWAPIDVSSPDTFYDGRIVNVSGLRRALDVKTGLYSISDMTVEVANTDKEITDLFKSYIVKNQIVEIFHTWRDVPEGWKYNIFRGIVEDVREKQPNYEFVIKDLLQKYFKVKVPRHVLTKAFYSKIKDSSINKSIPERLGLHYLNTTETKGALLALCVDTEAFEYIAAYGSMHSITEVFADNVLVDPAQWDIAYKDGGRTYIDFTVDMGNKKITFNGCGYMFGEWNSENGYVQNPAYIIAFLFALLAEIPLAYLNLEKIDALAAIFEDQEYDESGRLDLHSQRDFDSVLAELLFTYGAKGYNGRDGRFDVEVKDISSFATYKMIWGQLDVKDRVSRDLYKGLVNRIRYRGDSYPAQSFFRYADIMTHSKSIEDFEAEIESRQSFDFPWTTSEAMIIQRVNEELLKRAYGEKRINFTLPIRFIEDLDLHSNIRFQDVIQDEEGRYYYIESIDYNFVSQSLKMIAIDLQYLLASYFILGDEDDLPSDWNNTVPDDRIFGYMCDEDTGLLPDGTPGKIMIDENLIGE